MRIKLITAITLFMAVFAMDTPARSREKNPWEAVDQALEQGRPRDALALTDSLYRKARLQTDYPQMLQALTYRMRIGADIDWHSTPDLYRQLSQEEPLFVSDAQAYAAYQQRMMELTDQYSTGCPYAEEIRSRLDKIYALDSLLTLSTPQQQPPFDDRYQEILFGLQRWSWQYDPDFYQRLQQACQQNPSLLAKAEMEYITYHYARFPKKQIRLLRELLAEQPTGAAQKSDPILREMAHRILRLEQQQLDRLPDSQQEAAAEKWLQECRQWKFRDLEKIFLAPEFMAWTQGIVAPGKAVQVHIRYRNLDRLTLRLVKQGKRQQVIRTSFHTAPGLLHQDTLLLQLPSPGTYELIFKTRPGKKVYKQQLVVSSVGILQRNRSGHATEIYVTDRASGRPLPQVGLEWEWRKAQERIYRRDTLQLQGFTPLSNPLNEKDPLIRILDPLTQEPFVQGIRYRNNPKRHPWENQTITVLTDRSLYRPGDTVQFKIIAQQYAMSGNRVLPHQVLQVLLTSSEGKVADSLIVTTNSLGSASGCLHLPQTGRNGRWSIQTNGPIVGYGSIRVEDYQLPNLNLEIDTPDHPLCFGDTLLQAGHLFDAAQAPLSDVRIRYQLERDGVLVQQGQVYSDAMGTFQIPLTFERPESDDDQPVYYCGYHLDLTATSPTGETCQNAQHYNLSDYPVNLEVHIPEWIIHHQPVETTVRTTFQYNEPIDLPATFLLWQGADTLLRQSFTTHQPLTIPWESFPEGNYNVEVRVPFRDQLLRESRQVHLLTVESRRLPHHCTFFFHPLHHYRSSQPSIQGLIGTSEKELWGELEIFDGQQRLYREAVHLTEGLQLLNLPYNPQWPDQVTLLWSGWFDGQSICHMETFQRDIPQESLQLRLLSKRDFTTPGQQEQWQIKVQAPGSEQGEILLSIFDRRTLDWQGLTYALPYRPLFREQVPYPHPLGGGMHYATETITEEAEYGTLADGAISVQRTMMGSAKNATPSTTGQTPVPYRDPLRQTLLFEPHLTFETDSAGNATVDLQFETGQHIGPYRALLLAHTADLKSASLAEDFIIRKAVSITPHLPLFVRANDTLVVSARAMNLTDRSLAGEALLRISCPTTGSLLLEQALPGELPPTEGRVFHWTFPVPDAADGLIAEISFVSAQHADGERHRILVCPKQETTFHALTQALKPGQTPDSGYLAKTPAQLSAAALERLKSRTPRQVMDWMDHYYFLCITQGSDQQKEQARERILEAQNWDGGVQWMPGMSSSYTLTLHFLNRFASLLEQGYLDSSQPELTDFLNKALNYCRDQQKDTLLYAWTRCRLLPLNDHPEEKQALQQLVRPLFNQARHFSLAQKVQWAEVLRCLDRAQEAEPVLASLHQYLVPHPFLGQYLPNAAVGAHGLLHPDLQLHARLARLFYETDDQKTAAQILQWMTWQLNNRLYNDLASVAEAAFALNAQPQNPFFDPTVPLFATKFYTTRQTVGQRDESGFGIRVETTYYLQQGQEWVPIREGEIRLTGETIKVRHEIHSDGPVDLVQVRFRRSTPLQPLQPRSGYQWRSATGYYREIEKEQTVYYLNTLPRGTTVIEDFFYLEHAGQFLAGETEINSLHAPEHYTRQAPAPKRLNVVDGS